LAAVADTRKQPLSKSLQVMVTFHPGHGPRPIGRRPAILAPRGTDLKKRPDAGTSLLVISSRGPVSCGPAPRRPPPAGFRRFNRHRACRLPRPPLDHPPQYTKIVVVGDPSRENPSTGPVRIGPSTTDMLFCPLTLPSPRRGEGGNRTGNDRSILGRTSRNPRY